MIRKMKIREWLKSGTRYRSERGISMIEAAVAVFLLAGAVLALSMGLSSGVLAEQKDDQIVTAQGLARTQMEYVKEYPYNSAATTYPTITAPDGFGITVSVVSVPYTNTNIQKVTANITWDGSHIFTLQDYKVNR